MGLLKLYNLDRFGVGLDVHIMQNSPVLRLLICKLLRYI